MHTLRGATFEPLRLAQVSRDSSSRAYVNSIQLLGHGTLAPTDLQHGRNTRRVETPRLAHDFVIQLANLAMQRERQLS